MKDHAEEPIVDDQASTVHFHQLVPRAKTLPVKKGDETAVHQIEQDQ